MRTISAGVKAVAAGGYHSMVVKEDNSIWATGSNEDGQFGDGSTDSTQSYARLSPFQSGIENAYAVHYDHTHMDLFS